MQAQVKYEIDPAAPVMSLSFAEVTNKENRKLLRYKVGL